VYLRAGLRAHTHIHPITQKAQYTSKQNSTQLHK